MSTGINLIGLEYRKSIEFTRLKKRLNRVVFLVLTIFIFFSIAVIGLFFYYSGSMKNNDGKIKVLKNQIAAMEEKESHAVVAADRIKLINKVVENRKSYLDFLNDLEKLLVSGLKVEALDFTANSLKLSGLCADNQVLSNLNDIVEQFKLKDDYSAINIIETRRLADGTYSISLELRK